MSKKATRQAYGEALVELGKINNLQKLVCSKKNFLKDILMWV